MKVDARFLTGAARKHLGVTRLYIRNYLNVTSKSAQKGPDVFHVGRGTIRCEKLSEI